MDARTPQAVLSFCVVSSRILVVTEISRLVMPPSSVTDSVADALLQGIDHDPLNVAGTMRPVTEESPEIIEVENSPPAAAEHSENIECECAENESDDVSSMEKKPYSRLPCDFFE